MKKQKRKRKNPAPKVVAKPGVRPLSLFHPEHPARLYGWGSKEWNERDTRVWK